MAITRAQQAKQMLQDGGRLGFKKGRDTDFQQRGMTKSEYNRRVAEGTIDRYRGPDDPPKPPQLKEVPL